MDREGDTAAHVAARWAALRPQVLLSFSAAGAPLSQRNARGRTARDEAAVVLAAASAAADAARRAAAAAAPQPPRQPPAAAAAAAARASLWDSDEDGDAFDAYYGQWEGVTEDLYEAAERDAAARDARRPPPPPPTGACGRGARGARGAPRRHVLAAECSFVHVLCLRRRRCGRRPHAAAPGARALRGRQRVRGLERCGGTAQGATADARSIEALSPLLTACSLGPPRSASVCAATRRRLSPSPRASCVRSRRATAPGARASPDRAWRRNGCAAALLASLSVPSLLLLLRAHLAATAPQTAYLAAWAALDASAESAAAAAAGGTGASAAPQPPLREADLPWPTAAGREADVADLVLAGVPPAAAARALRAELVRWHPDKFGTRWGARLAPAERERVNARVNALAQRLAERLREARGAARDGAGAP